MKNSRARWRFLPLLFGLTSLVMGFSVSGSSRMASALTPNQDVQTVDVTSQTVQYSSATGSIEAYLAKPTGAGKHSAVILVHDDQGLNEAMRETVELFAREGFVTLAPNLESRLAPMSPSTGGGTVLQSQIRQLSANQSAEEVRAAFTFLENEAGVDAAKISAVGFGWGGWRVFKLAEQVPTLYRAVVFYGTTSDSEELNKIRTPILGHYAEYDFQTTANVLASKRRLGERFSYQIYPDTDRGFWSGSSGAIDYTALTRGRSDDTERRAASEMDPLAQRAVLQAWERTLAFLRSN